MKESNLIFDSASVRSIDANGFMHVALTPISKATVNPYLGREIPGWQEQGLEADRIYYGLRDPEELKKQLRLSMGFLYLWIIMLFQQITPQKNMLWEVQALMQYMMLHT